jgi:two-component system NtrC family response regulator
MDNPWPGNVRELKNIIERGMILSENNLINVKALPFCQKSCQEPREQGFSTLEEVERSHISMVMHAVQGNKSKAAQVLGIGRKTLYRKLEEYRLTEAGGQELRVLNK